MVTWFYIRTLLTISDINKWHSRQVDFVQAYPQAPIDYDLYMELPNGFNTIEVDGRTHVLQLLKNLYRQKQVGQVCKHHLNDALLQVGFKKLAVDECVWYQNKTIFFYYVDNGTFMGPESGAIDKAIEEVEISGLDIKDKVNIEYHLGVNIKEQVNVKIKMAQPQIIDSIINYIQIPKNTAPQQTPSLSTKIFLREASSPPFNELFNYKTVVGKLNFL